MREIPGYSEYSEFLGLFHLKQLPAAAKNSKILGQTGQQQVEAHYETL